MSHVIARPGRQGPVMQTRAGAGTGAGTGSVEHHQHQHQAMQQANVCVCVCNAEHDPSKAASHVVLAWCSKDRWVQGRLPPVQTGMRAINELQQ